MALPDGASSAAPTARARRPRLLAQLLQRLRSSRRPVHLAASGALQRAHADRWRSQAHDATLVAAFERIEAARGAITLTFFEYNTLAALELFREPRSSAMVLEVGLGGRLDATNILDADVAVLCSVGLDHRDWLGDTLGADRRGEGRHFSAPASRSCWAAPQMPASVWRAAQRAASARSATAEREFRLAYRWRGYERERWDYRCSPVQPRADCRRPALAGAIQYRNAATALAALQLLGVAGALRSRRVSREAPASVRLPGRFQIVPGEVEWILDVAHNEPAAQVLAAGAGARGRAGPHARGCGMLADKDAPAIARGTRCADRSLAAGRHRR